MTILASKSLRIKLCAFTFCSTLVGCGQGFESLNSSQVVNRAPTSQEETGYIVSNISEEDISHLAKKFPTAGFRQINKTHGLYEIFGPSYKEIRSEVSSQKVVIEKNKFVELKSVGKSPRKQFQKVELFDKSLQKTDEPGEEVFSLSRHPIARLVEQIHGISLSGEVLEFVEECLVDENQAPEIIVENNQGLDKFTSTILFELGATLELSADKSASKKNDELEFQWIITNPDDSALDPSAFQDKELTYDADTTGMYVMSIVAKDSRKYCNLNAQPFYVTANDTFDPKTKMPDSASDKIDMKTFWHVFHVGSRNSWSRALGTDFTVSIIDTGVDYNHPAIASNILINQNEVPSNNVDDDNNGFIDDYTGYDFGHNDGYPLDDFGHGTHVAGIAASNVFGAARKSKILTAKVGVILGFDVASVTGAMLYSADQGAQVVNMSLGWPDDVAVIRNAMNYLEEKNILVVVAAGNETTNNDVVASYPANYPNRNVISVAASDENDALTEYSNFGKKVHIAAPGGTIEKPIISAYKKNPRDRKFVGLMGTSMASPLVAGVAAQVWSANPSLTASELRTVLIESGKPSAKLSGKILSGKVIDAQSALDQVLGTGPESSSIP